MGDLMSSGIGADKFEFKKLQQQALKKDTNQLSQDYNYFSELQSGVKSGDVEAAQQAMAISLFSVKNDGSDNAKNLERNNVLLSNIKAEASNVLRSNKDEEAKKDGNTGQKNSNAEGQLAPSLENVAEIKKILQEQGDDDITDEDIMMFLETNSEFE